MIVDQLKAAGVYDETAIVISADHGENQGELGIYGEHAHRRSGDLPHPDDHQVARRSGGDGRATDCTTTSTSRRR